MAEVIPQKNGYIDAESLPLGASAETLVAAGATIPQGTTEIVVFVPSGDSIHMAPSVTPTSTLGTKVTLGHPGIINHNHQKVMQLISDDASDVTCVLVYKGSAGRQDLAHTKTEPF